MQAGAGHLAHREQVGDAGAAEEVGDHATALVVRGGNHRDGLHRHVDAELPAGLVDVREVVEQEPLRQVGHVEEGAVVAAPLHLGVDGAGHDVARGQLLARVVADHEGLARLVAKDPALAAERLGDEEALGVGVEEAGGVELEELHVGDRGAGPVAHGHAVAGRHVGVGRVEVDLPGAAGGEHGHRGGDGPDAAGGPVDDVGAERPVRSGRAGPLAGDDVDGDLVLLDADAGRRAGRQHLLLDLLAGGVLGVGHPAARVAALPGEVEPVGGLPVELDPQGLEPADPLRGLLDRHLDRVEVAQSGAGDEGVLDVEREGVVGPQHRGHPALGVLGVALLAVALGEDEHAPVTGRLQGEGEAGHPPTQDQEVDVLARGRGHGADP